MKYPISTGQAAELLATTEPKLAELVRRGHVRPAPPIFAGRRLWGPQHLKQAAEHLGVLTAALAEQLDRPVPDGGVHHDQEQGDARRA